VGDTTCLLEHVRSENQKNNILVKVQKKKKENNNNNKLRNEQGQSHLKEKE